MGKNLRTSVSFRCNAGEKSTLKKDRKKRRKKSLVSCAFVDSWYRPDRLSKRVISVDQLSGLEPPSALSSGLKPLSVRPALWSRAPIRFI